MTASFQTLSNSSFTLPLAYLNNLRFNTVTETSSLNIVTRLRARRPGIDSRQGLGFFFSPRHCVQTGPGGPPSLVSSGYWGVKLTTHLHLVSRLRMRKAISPLPKYFFTALCLAKHRDSFTLTFTLPLPQHHYSVPTNMWFVISEHVFKVAIFKRKRVASGVSVFRPRELSLGCCVS
jgi:hypothetical protein